MEMMRVIMAAIGMFAVEYVNPMSKIIDILIKESQMPKHIHTGFHAPLHDLSYKSSTFCNGAGRGAYMRNELLGDIVFIFFNIYVLISKIWQYKSIALRHEHVIITNPRSP